MIHPPGPRGLATLGFLSRNAADTLAFLERTARRYGPLASFRLGPQRVYVLDDAALIADVLVTQQHRFVRDTGAVILRELVGDGLLTSEDPRHLERRRMMQPAFHRARVAAYARAMTDEALRMASAWERTETIDIAAEMRRITLSIVGNALFGADLRESAQAVTDILARVLRRAANVAPLFALAAPLVAAARRRASGPQSLLFPRERAELDAVIAPIVARRRSAGAREGDLLWMLLEARGDDGSGLSERDVRNEVVTLVLAGHETTATALSWAWYALARNPHVEARLHAELDRELAGRAPLVDDLARLTYTNNVFAEALRLYPPAAAFGRRPLERVNVGGYTLERMSTVMLSPYVTQRNPRYYDDPLAFRPERWERADELPKFAYFPFGGGSKQCIGEPFARLEGVLVLATLAQRFRLRPADEGEVGVAPGLTLAPDRPMLAHPLPRERRSPAASA